MYWCNTRRWPMRRVVDGSRQAAPSTRALPQTGRDALTRALAGNASAVVERVRTLCVSFVRTSRRSAEETVWRFDCALISLIFVFLMQLLWTKAIFTHLPRHTKQPNLFLLKELDCDLEFIWTEAALCKLGNEASVRNRVCHCEYRGHLH